MLRGKAGGAEGDSDFGDAGDEGDAGDLVGSPVDENGILRNAFHDDGAAEGRVSMIGKKFEGFGDTEVLGNAILSQITQAADLGDRSIEGSLYVLPLVAEEEIELQPDPAKSRADIIMKYF